MAESFLSAPAIAAELGEIRLAPHQVDAAARLLALMNDWGGAVLADATGLGKTFVAAAVARLHAPSLVVAPAALRTMWRDSLGRTGVAADVESYEALSRGHAVARKPSLLILDEAHHARNPKARRYAALAELAWGAKVLLLTATPVHNRTGDLRALIALFLGSAAEHMTGAELMQLVVRRTPEQTNVTSVGVLPRVRPPEWFTVPTDYETFRAIRALPPAVPTADGAPAHALLVLGLLRAWSSSEAALRASLRRRLRRAASLDVALESGRLLDRRELAAWPVVDDAIQLGFPEFMVRGPVDTARIRSVLQEHVDGVRAVLRHLDRNDGAADRARLQALRSICEARPLVPVVAFTQLADTAAATFRNCMNDGGVALVTGKGARVASGRVTVDEIVRGFDVTDERRESSAMPLLRLIATDVLSEGLSLRRAGILVHLDLPWTMARLEQRVGRLRRPGSRHEFIEVHAIGPPVSARELIPVMRALQRKARVADGIVGDSELQNSLPLLGRRLARLHAGRAGDDAASMTERLRVALGSWASGRECEVRSDPREGAIALGLVVIDERQVLVAVTDSQVTEKTADVLRAVEVLGERGMGTTVDVPRHVGASIDRWLEAQKGRELARGATDVPSAAHASVLRMLQDALSSASRMDRTCLTPTIRRLRQRVLAARGAGAERALQRFMEENGDVTALDALLGSRAGSPDSSVPTARLVALLCFDPPSMVSACLVDRHDQ